MIRSSQLAHRATYVLLALFTSIGAATAEDGGALLDQMFPRSSLQIATPDARLHRFDVWVADTDRRRARGLMFVKDLDEDEGMLFIYPRQQEVSMWMKNTFISLDMLFIREDGRVERVVQDTTPHSLETIASGEPVTAVLELKAGTAARLKIARGAQVIHPGIALREIGH